MTPQSPASEPHLSFGHELPPEESPAPGKGTIRILQLYPRDMNIYGDWGKRPGAGAAAALARLHTGTARVQRRRRVSGGRRLDRRRRRTGQRQLVIQDDLLSRETVLKELAENGTPMLVICGLYQLFGKFFKTRTGSVIRGSASWTWKPSAPRTADRQRVRVLPRVRHRPGYENHSGPDHPRPGRLTPGNHGQGHRQQQQRRPRGRPLPEHRGELPSTAPAAKEPGRGGLPHPGRRRTQVRQLLPGTPDDSYAVLAREHAAAARADPAPGLVTKPRKAARSPERYGDPRTLPAPVRRCPLRTGPARRHPGTLVLLAAHFGNGSARGNGDRMSRR